MPELIAMFNNLDEGIQNWKKVHPQLSLRSDLHAFLLLDRLIPGSRDMVWGADHDIIYLNADIDKLAEVITEEQVIELMRCGVFYHTETDCLAMFV